MALTESIEYDKIEIIFIIRSIMIKEAILKAISHTLIISMLLIIPTLGPLYILGGIMTRQIQEKIN